MSNIMIQIVKSIHLSLTCLRLDHQDELLATDLSAYKESTTADNTPLSSFDYKEFRQIYDKLLSVKMKSNKFNKITFKTIESLDCVIIEPHVNNNTGKHKNTFSPTINGFIMYLHGGGYCIGPIEIEYLLYLTRYTCCSVISVGYPLCPESSIDDSIEAVLKVYDYCINSKDDNDIMTIANWSHDNCVFMGSSAGGGLCLLLLQRLRDRKRALPLCAWLSSPCCKKSIFTRG